MPYRDTAEYRRKAGECLLRAKATDDVLLKMHLLELADTWKIKADSVEKIPEALRKARRGTLIVILCRGHHRTAGSPQGHRLRPPGIPLAAGLLLSGQEHLSRAAPLPTVIRIRRRQ